MDARAAGSFRSLRQAAFLLRDQKYATGDVEARITVKECATAKRDDLKFYASADLELNQKALKFRPCGWSDTLFGALGECMRNFRKFEYEPEEHPALASPE